MARLGQEQIYVERKCFGCGKPETIMPVYEYDQDGVSISNARISAFKIVLPIEKIQSDFHDAVNIVPKTGNTVLLCGRCYEFLSQRFKDAWNELLNRKGDGCQP